ncbi:MAG: S49 family peptidase [Chloroflexi bacterium]|nr:S49 family peptidase [Chloroflexota bacterium]
MPVIGDFFEKKPKVAVLRLSGIIADSSCKKQGISHHRLAKAIDKAFERPGVGAVALVINSPGGSAVQSALIGNHIRQMADDKDRPVYAFVEDVAASGGYWLACAADEIYAQEASIVGSIGVISASFGFEDFIAKHGIHRRLHTAGKEKSFLDPFVAEKKEDVARLEELQRDIHGSFKDWVGLRRGDKLDGGDKDLFEGQFWTAGPAMEKGIIDGIGDVRSFMREKFGDKVKFLEMTPSKKMRFPFSLMGKLEMPGLSADDVLDTLETRALWSRYGL